MEKGKIEGEKRGRVTNGRRERKEKDMELQFTITMDNEVVSDTIETISCAKMQMTRKLKFNKNKLSRNKIKGNNLVKYKGHKNDAFNLSPQNIIIV